MVSLSKKEEEKNRVPKLDSLSPFQIRGFGVFTLFQNEMVILLLIFGLCKFTSAYFLKMKEEFTLFRESQLMLLKLLWKDKFALMDLTLLLCEFGNFTLFWIEELGYILKGLERIFSTKFKPDFYKFQTWLKFDKFFNFGSNMTQHAFKFKST